MITWLIAGICAVALQIIVWRIHTIDVHYRGTLTAWLILALAAALFVTLVQALPLVVRLLPLGACLAITLYVTRRAIKEDFHSWKVYIITRFKKS